MARSAIARPSPCSHAGQRARLPRAELGTTDEYDLGGNLLALNVTGGDSPGREICTCDCR
jgi:hypothetical protein